MRLTGFFFPSTLRVHLSPCVRTVLTKKQKLTIWRMAINYQGLMFSSKSADSLVVQRSFSTNGCYCWSIHDLDVVKKAKYWLLDVSGYLLRSRFNLLRHYLDSTSPNMFTIALRSIKRNLMTVSIIWWFQNPTAKVHISVERCILAHWLAFQACCWLKR